MNSEFYREGAEIISVCASLAEYVGYDAEEKDFRRVYAKALPWRNRILGSWLGPAKEQVEREWTGAVGDLATIMEEGLYFVSSFLGREGWEAAESVWIYHAHPKTEEDRQTLMRLHDRAYIEKEEERRDSLRGRCRNLFDKFNATLNALRGVGVPIDIHAPDARAVLAAIREVTAASMPAREPSRARVRYEVTQQEAAEQLGVSVRTVKNWESGKSNPHGYTREKRRSRAEFGVFVATLWRDRATAENMMEGAGSLQLGNRMGMGVKKGTK